MNRRNVLQALAASLASLWTFRQAKAGPGVGTPQEASKGPSSEVYANIGTLNVAGGTVRIRGGTVQTLYIERGGKVVFENADGMPAKVTMVMDRMVS